jgi:hypothetical protein
MIGLSMCLGTNSHINNIYYSQDIHYGKVTKLVTDDKEEKMKNGAGFLGFVREFQRSTWKRRHPWTVIKGTEDIMMR